MSYYAQSQISLDEAMLSRVAMCYADEGGLQDPGLWASSTRWEWATAPGWDDAWDSALAADNPDPGADPTVITDLQILGEVQLLMEPRHTRALHRGRPSEDEYPAG